MRHKPYEPPRFTRHDSKTKYPDWTKNAVQSIREELVKSSPLSGEAPEYVTVVDSDRKYIEVSVSEIAKN
jgi:hypothetical protein